MWLATCKYLTKSHVSNLNLLKLFGVYAGVISTSPKMSVCQMAWPGRMILCLSLHFSPKKFTCEGVLIPFNTRIFGWLCLLDAMDG